MLLLFLLVGSVSAICKPRNIEMQNPETYCKTTKNIIHACHARAGIDHNECKYIISHTNTALHDTELAAPRELHAYYYRYNIDRYTVCPYTGLAISWKAPLNTSGLTGFKLNITKHGLVNTFTQIIIFNVSNNVITDDTIFRYNCFKTQDLANHTITVSSLPSGNQSNNSLFLKYAGMYECKSRSYCWIPLVHASQVGSAIIVNFSTPANDLDFSHVAALLKIKTLDNRNVTLYREIANTTTAGYSTAVFNNVLPNTYKVYIEANALIRGACKCRRSFECMDECIQSSYPTLITVDTSAYCINGN